MTNVEEIDDDVDWDEWMKLSDDQQDAIVNREMKAYGEMLDEMSPDELYRYKRQFILGTLKRSRAGIRLHAWTAESLMRHVIRPSQKNLLALRIWRQTGAWPAFD